MNSGRKSSSADISDVNTLMEKLNHKLAIRDESNKFKNFPTKNIKEPKNTNQFVNNYPINQFVKNYPKNQFGAIPASNLSDYIKKQLNQTRATEDISSIGFIVPKLLTPNHSDMSISEDSVNFNIPLLKRFELQNDKKEVENLSDDIQKLKIENKQKTVAKKEELAQKKVLVDLTAAINSNVNKDEAIAISLKCKASRLKALEEKYNQIKEFDSIQNIRDTYQQVAAIDLTPKYLSQPSPFACAFCVKLDPKFKRSKRKQIDANEIKLHLIKRFNFETPSPDDIVAERIRRIRSSYMHK